MAAALLKDILRRVGEEKVRARTERTRPPREAEYLLRAEACLRLYEELRPLRLARLVAELGTERAALEKIRAETKRAEREQEEALLRVQNCLYGCGP